jgi:hypothetical protein
MSRNFRLFQGSVARDVARRMWSGRGRGDGLYVHRWRESHGETLLESVLDWCRRTAGETRRPFGIDHFDLALALRSPETGAVRSSRFARLRPADLYGEPHEGLRSFVAEHTAAPEGVLVSVALYSWGDAAHGALPPR